MSHTILIVAGVLFILFLVFMLYCCLVVASREDDLMERLYLEQKARAVSEMMNAGAEKAAA